MSKLPQLMWTFQSLEEAVDASSKIMRNIDYRLVQFEGKTMLASKVPGVRSVSTQIAQVGDSYKVTLLIKGEPNTIKGITPANGVGLELTLQELKMFSKVN